MEALGKLWFYTRDYRRSLLAGVTALALAEIAGLLPPWLMKLAVDYISGVERVAVVAVGNPLAAYCLLFIAAAGIQASLRWCWRKRLFGMPRLIQHRLRQECLGHLQRLSQDYFQRRKVGDIMSHFTNDVDNIDEFIVTAVTFIVNIALVIPVSFTLLVAISVKLTVVSMVPMLAVSLLLVRYKRRIRGLSDAVQEQLAAIYSLVQESVAGIRVIQAYARESEEIDRFARLNDGLAGKKLALATAAEGLTPVMVFANGLTVALVIWLGGQEVIRGNLTLGSYLAFTAYLAILTYAVAGIGSAVNTSQQVLGSLQRIEGLLAACPPPGAVDGTGRAQATRLRGKGIGGKADFRGEIELKALTFSYEGRRNVLAGVDLTIGAGTWLAVAGPVGSGKSSLAKAIMGIHAVPRGAIFIDGIDMLDIPADLLHELIGYVEQEPFLFSDTIRENIGFGAGDVPPDEIVRAAALAGLDRDLAAMAGGLDTIIGERGVTLSGGQKQRVALARAVIKQPRILILDDACSNLDADTEQRVLANIREAFRHTTFITISHRVSTLRNADVVAIFNAGGIAELGSHDDLVATGGLYNRLYKTQYFGEKGIIEE